MTRLRCVLGVLAILVLAGAWRAEAGREAGIKAAIGGQLQAFGRGDTAHAFALGSPTIKDTFGSADQFAAMVAKSTAQLYRPQSFKFLSLARTDGKLIQRVRVQGADGSVVTALYEMVKVDGEWRINDFGLLMLARTAA